MKYFIFLFFILSTLISFSQGNPAKSKDKVVPFTVVETIPVYPGCERHKSNDLMRKCLSEKITSFINENFYISGNTHKLKGKHRITVMFKIDTEGYVKDVNARAVNVVLKEEAIRVVQKLPKMKPATQEGKPITVPYAIPVNFTVK